MEMVQLHINIIKHIMFQDGIYDNVMNVIKNDLIENLLHVNRR